MWKIQENFIDTSEKTQSLLQNLKFFKTFQSTFPKFFKYLFGFQSFTELDLVNSIITVMLHCKFHFNNLTYSVVWIQLTYTKSICQKILNKGALTLLIKSDSRGGELQEFVYRKNNQNLENIVIIPTTKKKSYCLIGRKGYFSNI